LPHQHWPGDSLRPRSARRGGPPPGHGNERGGARMGDQARRRRVIIASVSKAIQESLGACVPWIATAPDGAPRDDGLPPTTFWRGSHARRELLPPRLLHR